MKQRHFIRYLAAIAALLMLLSISLARAGTLTAATGGGSIPADTTPNGGTGAWTTLAGPVYRDAANSGLIPGTVVLTVPAGFEFNASVVVSVVLTAGDATAANNVNHTAVNGNVATTANSTLTVTANTISFTIGFQSQAIPADRIQWQNIQVRPLNGTPLASGPIVASGTAAITTGAGTSNFGTLTEVAGALSKLHVVLPGQSFTSGTGVTGTPTVQTAGVSFTIVQLVATGSSFNHIVTGYSGNKTISYSGPSGSPSYTSPVSFTNGQSTTTLATTITVAQTTTITVSDGTTTGPASSSLTVLSTSANSFNAFENNTAAGATNGVVKTKISARAFSLDIVALTSTPAVSGGFTGAVKVELLDSGGAGNCGTWPVNQTLANQTFIAGDNGRHRIATITESNAWKNVHVRISYPTSSPTITSCSSDGFAIRPSTLAALAITDLNWQTAGVARTLNNIAIPGGVVHKAGQPFTMTATAQNSSGSTTSNYSGTPTAVLTQCGTAACPALANLGALNVGVWSANAGVITTTTASYSDAGALGLTLQDQHFADVDAADSSTAERFINSSTGNVGRFVPDHFDFTNLGTPQFKTLDDSTCAARTFTYIGQPFGYLTAPQATVTARNATGGVTANYQGALWALTAISVTQTYAPLSPAAAALDTSLIGAPAVTSNNNGTGTVSVNSGDKLFFIRSNVTPQAFFTANITLTINISDSGENGTAGNGIITSAVALLFNGGGSGIAFDAGSIFRFGRLRLSNALGSEMLDLPVRMRLQSWNGTGFVDVAATDSCATVIASDITLTFPVDVANLLAACDTTVSLIAGLPVNFKLTKPGSGHHGWTALRVNLGPIAAGDTCIGALATLATTANKSYLRGNWGVATFDQDPTAFVRFGAYRGSEGVLYRRENY